MKNKLFKLLLALVLIPSSYSFSQGSNTPAGSTGVPVTIPFASAGSTVGAANDVDPTPGTPNIEGGNDWFYYFCATTTGVINVTLTYNGSATPQAYPSIQAFTDVALTNYAGTPGLAAASVSATPSTANTSNTIGFPLSVTAGSCYYIMVDNYNLNTTGYTYNLSMTYSTTTTTPTLQPACTNIGFDNGSTSGWFGNWGHTVVNGAVGAPTPTYTPVNGTLNAGHHNITTPGLDPFTGAVNTVCPLIPGNTNSVLLGDGPNASFGGAQIMQKFSVTASNALLTYYYAAVMQDAGTDHQNYEQPFFKIEALDCSNNPIACGNYLVTGGPGIPGFVQIPGSIVYYKDWTPVLLDLTPYIGTCVTIKFSIGDCSRGAHFAYAYLDATCGPLQIVAPPTVCQFNTSTLSAPLGAASYSWVNTAAPGTVLGTNSTLSITPTTTGNITYQCTMTNVSGCNTTVTTTVNVLPSPQITVTNPAPACSPSTVDITSPAVVTINSGSGTISYFQDAACTIPIANPAAITTSGTYYIKILNANGCFEVEAVTVVVNATPTVNVTTANQSICPGQSVNLNATIAPAGVNVPVTFTNPTDFVLNDGSLTPVNSVINVSGITPQTAGVLPIVSVNLNITHTYDEDLTIWLVCPNGSIIDLSSDNGGAGDNYTNTTFVPSGSPSVTTGVAPFTGSFTPEQAFTFLNGCGVNGNWTLQIYDLASGDVGTLTDWSITFNNFVPTTFNWSPTTAMTNPTTLTPIVTPATTTTYTFTGTNNVGGCTATDAVTITVNPLPSATISGTTTVCQNAAAPTITFQGSGATAPYTFTYNINGGAPQTVVSNGTGLATVTAPTGTAGTFVYNLTSVTTAAGCPTTLAVNATVTVNPNPSATISGTTTVCQNATAPTITFQGSGATAPYTFTYNINGGAPQTVVSNGTGIATVTAPTGTAGTFVYNLTSVTTAAGCPTTLVVNATVTVNPLPIVNPITSIVACPGTTVNVPSFVSNPAGATFSWTNSTTGIGLGASGAGDIPSFTATNSTASTISGTITVTPTLSGCVGSPVTFTISVDQVPVADAGPDFTLCTNSTQIGSTPVAGLNYSWSPVTNLSNPLIANPTVTFSGGTMTYTVTATTANGCSATDDMMVSLSPPPTASISGNATVCQNDPSPVVSFTGANGTAPYTITYSINNGSTLSIVTDAAGNATTTAPTATAGSFVYTLIDITAADGCNQTQTTSITVLVNALPNGIASGTTSVCQNATAPVVTFTGSLGTAPYTFTYNINGGGNQTIVSNASGVATISAPTGTTGSFVYTLTNVVSASGCSQTVNSPITITVNTLPTISGTLSACVGATTQLTGSPTANATNPWVSSAPAVASVDNTGLITGISAGTTVITYTNSNGCSVTATVTINPLPTITGTLTICEGATSQLIGSPTPDATTPWASSNLGVATVSNTGLVTGVLAGTTTITYINANGCSETATVTVSPVPTISGTLSACVGATTQLTGSGTANATTPWASSNTGVATVSNTGLVTGISAGTSTITYTNSAGCQITEVVTINATPTITGTFNLCVGTTSQLTGSPTADAITPWTSSNTTVATIDNTGLVTAVSGGTTTITYLNSTGCSTTQIITVNSLPTATIASNSTVCAGSTATYTITGTPNATVTYQVGATNQTGVIPASGTLTITTGVLNATLTVSLVSIQGPAPANCTANLTGSITITVNPNPTMDPVQNVTVCPGVQVNVPNFVSNPAGASFAWTNTNTGIGLAAQGVNNIAPFTATNSGGIPISGTVTVAPVLNGCVGSSQTFTITVSPTPNAEAGNTVTACLNDPGVYQIGTAPVVGNSYSWSPSTGLNDATISNPTVSTAAAGTVNYTVTVTNAGGCVATDVVTVTINDLPVVGFISDITEGCAPMSVVFTNTSPNSVNCEWTFEGAPSQFGCGSITQIYNTAGIFDVGLTITDANGCSNSATVTDMITVYPQVNASFGVDNLQTTIIDPTFHFFNTSTNATSYSWDFGDGGTSTATNPSHTYADQPGTYNITLHAYNAFGCEDVAQLVITVVDELIVYVPNTFTPDGDEFNNVFFPVFSSGFDPTTYTMYIFDRWGEIIFETHNTDIGWDGTYHNELCKEGVYTWKIEIKERGKDKRREFVGHVTLLK